MPAYLESRIVVNLMWPYNVLSPYHNEKESANAVRGFEGIRLNKNVAGNFKGVLLQSKVTGQDAIFGSMTQAERF